MKRILIVTARGLRKRIRRTSRGDGTLKEKEKF